jgi:hypothetical protein
MRRGTTEHSNVDPLASIESVGDFETSSIRASMVAFLARPGRAQNAEAARLMLAKMAEEAGPDGQRTRLEAARLISFLPDLFDRELRLLLQYDDPDVARAAITAAGQLKKRIFVGRIIERMVDPALVPTAVEALASFGDRIVGTLRDFLVDPEMPIDVRQRDPVGAAGDRDAPHRTCSPESVLDTTWCSATTASRRSTSWASCTTSDRWIARSSNRCSPPRSWGTTAPTR